MSQSSSFPHHVLLEPPRIRYAKLYPDEVRRAAFADFRLNLPEDRLFEHPLPEMPAGLGPGQGARLRFIFHTAFCGSTLIAGLLDRPGETLVLREPQGLRDLAEIKAYYLDWMGLARLQGMLEAYVSALDEWAAGEGKMLLKPSNLCNGLAHDLLGLPGSPKALLLSCSLQDFLLACLGKDDRLLKLITYEVSHWHRNFPHRRRYEIDPVLLRQNRLYGPAVLWHLQRLHLAQVRKDYPGATSEIMDFAGFRANANDFMDSVAGFLGLPLDQAAVAHAAAIHAKTGKPFSAARERERRTELAGQHRKTLEVVATVMEPLLEAFPV